MDTTAKLITSIAALVAAIAWPAAFLIVIFTFRKQLREQLGRLRKGKVGFVEIELEHVAASAVTGVVETTGAITAEQVHSAARIEARSADIGQPELLRQLDKLSIEYDTVRRTLVPGPSRTAAMTRILVQMRAIGPSVAQRVDVYKSSGSPGSRLAAIAIMQMHPQVADIPWLVQRFKDDAPFIFYHAALALQNVANEADEETRSTVRLAAGQALKIVKSFSGTPDQETIDVLEHLCS
jgi:hypothetical protein